jgi:SAM-dependent methyltransferase
VVFNSGVMEHFEPDDLRRGLIEMARVLKPGGKLICLVPSARGWFYTQGKRRLEQLGQWQFGVEYPQRSLRGYLAGSGLKCLREYQIGARHQIWFVRGRRRRLAKLLMLPFRSERNRIATALFGGYLLTSVWRKPDQT